MSRTSGKRARLAVALGWLAVLAWMAWDFHRGLSDPATAENYRMIMRSTLPGYGVVTVFVILFVSGLPRPRSRASPQRQ